jgi:hypothetical protein
MTGRTCADIRDQLDAWLLQRLSRRDAEAIAAHLAGCPACRTLLADLRTIQAEARRIGEEGPPPGAWERLARVLERAPEVQRVRADAAADPPRGEQWSNRWLALAAVFVAAVGLSLLVMQRTLQDPGPGRPGAFQEAAAAVSLVETIELELEKAAQHYENAIAGLEQIAHASDTPLDPVVMATLRESLQVIDQAIDESRQALRSEPGSLMAQESLFDAFRRKVSLLQDTIALMNEMRKGNQAGAAAIATGLNKG